MYTFTGLEASALRNNLYKLADGVPYQLLFSKYTKILESNIQLNIIPMKFTTIHDILNLSLQGDRFNLYAIVVSVTTDCEYVNKDIFYRKILLIDDSNTKLILECKLWKTVANDMIFSANDVICIKNAKLDNYKPTKSITIYENYMITKVNDKRTSELKRYMDFCIFSSKS